MLRLLVFSVALVMPQMAAAAQCSLSDARYTQDEAAWWLTFIRVPQFTTPNQVAAFYIEMPNSSLTLEGAIHVPNGFGAPLWRVSGPCSPDSAERCGFVDTSAQPAAYGLYGDAIRFFDFGEDAVAPDQLILPGLAEAMWYSHYRGTEWDTDGPGPGDAFRLVGCD